MKKTFKVPIPTTASDIKQPIEKPDDLTSSVRSVGSIRNPVSSAGKDSQGIPRLSGFLRKNTSSVNLGLPPIMGNHTRRENPRNIANVTSSSPKGNHLYGGAVSPTSLHSSHSSRGNLDLISVGVDL